MSVRQQQLAVCRSLEREAHYVDLEASPVTGSGQADLQHLLPANSSAAISETPAATTSEPQSSSTSDGSASGSPSTALNPAANAPVSAKPAKAANVKNAKKPAKAEAVPSAPPASLQDVATSLVQQVQAHQAWLEVCVYHPLSSEAASKDCLHTYLLGHQQTKAGHTGFHKSYGGYAGTEWCQC